MIRHGQEIALIRYLTAATLFVLLIAATGLYAHPVVIDSVLCGFLILLAYLAWHQGYAKWAVVYGIGVLVFNPFIVLPLSPAVWVLVDLFFVVVVLALAVYITDGYVKGARFETHIIGLFPQSQFTVVDRTRDSGKFLARFVESDTYPDVVLRNNATQYTFAIECKWRRAFTTTQAGESGLWIKESKLRRYRLFEKDKKIPVHFAFGIGGTPENPAHVYCMPLADIRHQFIAEHTVTSGKSAPEFIAKVS
ncbi:MAG: hypothetical protein KBE09_05560 [Candidatus Pacebacteria bacterium]|nr:hypothetical protein [Candidatus Paceibacterota bacterium]